MQYKEITLEDINQLAAIYMDTFNSSPWNDTWTMETASKRLQQMVNIQDSYGLIAFDEDGLCGMILGGEEQYYDRRIFNIKEFCVNNKLRGKGIGTALLTEFETRLKEHGINEIILITATGDQTEGFYASRNYGIHNNLVIMGKQL